MFSYKKINLVVLFFLLLCFIGGTFSYYSSKHSISNSFYSLNYHIRMRKDVDNSFGKYVVSIFNEEEDNTSVLLRIRYDENWTKMIGNDMDILSNKIGDVDVLLKEWTNEFVMNFQLDEDGWYYYKKVFSPKRSFSIIKSISLNENIRNSSLYNKYKDYDYELSFRYEAVQANKEAVKEIWNKDIKIEGENVIWCF